MTNLDSLLKGVQVLTVLCNQYGDTGKGKFSDLFASKFADITVRGTGGANAGHTVVIGANEYVFHLFPAGILYDAEGKTTMLGNGMVIEPGALGLEFDMLDSEGITYNNLKISQDANVTLPFHVMRDQAKNKSQRNGGIGSTGRGIGPTYEDKIGRRGITIGDLYHEQRLIAKIDELRKLYPEFKESTQSLVDNLRIHADRIHPYVCDTVALLHQEIGRGKKVNIEAAQGALLSIEHGMRKFATSSDCTLNGTASGVGLPATAIDLVFGIFKFPVMTRVGGGPFTTEIGGEKAYEESAGRVITDDLNDLDVPYTQTKSKYTDGNITHYDINHPNIRAAINSTDVLAQNQALRLAGNEYGATTGRARRIGWFDAVAAKYACNINGRQKLILTKADTLAGINSFNVSYRYDTPNGQTDQFSREPEDAAASRPIYTSYDGFGNIHGVTNEGDLPRSLLQAARDLGRFVKQEVAIISTGKDQCHNVIL